ncbi:MAG: DUF2752 domain-containing protein [Pseudonocardia sp.]
MTAPRPTVDREHLRLLLRLYVSVAGLLALLGSRTPTACPYRRLTRRPCPLCGLTRSVGLTLTGQVRRSAATHPLGPLVVLAAVADLVATVWSARAGVAGPVNPSAAARERRTPPRRG